MKRLGRSATAFLALAMAAFAVSGMAVQAHAAQAAQAQGSGRGGVFGSGNGPIDITADQLEVIDAENRAIWRGSVEAIQGGNRMRSPSLTVYFARSGTNNSAPGAGWGAIQRMEAEGPVFYVTPQQNARGDHAVYDAASNTIVMTGKVVLVQDKNVVQGDRLVIDTTTNHATLSTTSGGRERVRGVFYPNQSQQGGSAPAAPAPAGRP